MSEQLVQAILARAMRRQPNMEALADEERAALETSDKEQLARLLRLGGGAGLYITVGSTSYKITGTCQVSGLSGSFSYSEAALSSGSSKGCDGAIQNGAFGSTAGSC